MGGLESTRKYHTSRLARVSPNLVAGKTWKVDFHVFWILLKSHFITEYLQKVPNFTEKLDAHKIEACVSGDGDKKEDSESS